LDKLNDIIHPTNDGLFRLNLKYFRKGSQGVISYGENHVPVVESMYNDHLVEKFGPARKPMEEITQYHRDVAASVQKKTGEVIFHILNSLQKKTGQENLCLAGGVAQNSVINGKITSNTSFKNVYIPSAGHDAGIAMGAALYVQHQVLKQKRQPVIRTAFTGSSYTNSQVKEILNERKVSFTEYEDTHLFGKITDCLVNGGVVGWFNGRAEFGPRALGGRSIIADPRNTEAKSIINSKIKRRENFRPFAPSILKEYITEYFELTEEVPFMEKVYQIRQDKQHEIPAVTHVDGSGRLQTVDQEISPRYYALIEVFRQRTGVPVLLNTSFNENEPIVNTPGEALDCYLRTNMDMLVMENILIQRNTD
jgi:carbamoyltransferase